MGHSIGLDDHYFKPGDNYVLQEYLKSVDNLTINEENRLKVKVEKLRARNESNEHIINSRLQEMQSQMQSVITALSSIDQSTKNNYAKQLFTNGLYKNEVHLIYQGIVWLVHCLC